MNADLATISVPGSNATLDATLINGVPFVALKPMCEALGIDVDGQRRKLHAKSWATTELSTAVAGDGKSREMLMIDRRTMTMWLATIDEGRVNEAARPILRAFQAQAADALDAYFHDGGAINPDATVDQLDRLTKRAQGLMSLLKLANGLVDPRHLEAKARIVIAQAFGETPELNPADIPLYVSDFLKDKGLANDMINAKASGFGKRLKGSYLAEHGETPKKAYQELPNGTVREVFAYTRADRPLFDEVWNRHYEGVTKAAS